MSRVDLYDNTYGHFGDEVLARVRAETYGTDIGQSGWVTAEEYQEFAGWLQLDRDRHALDVGCGSGGPALHLARLTGGRVTGIDINVEGIATARRQASAAGLESRVTFEEADMDGDLPFAGASFDAIVSMDAMCHMTQRAHVLAQWRRVLRPGGRAVFTDPVVITGAVTSDEFAIRSSIGRFLFVPPGINQQLIEQAGFRLARALDLSESGAYMAGRWHDARAHHRRDLVALEGEQRFEGLQRFLSTVQRVMGERRLSRIAYFVEPR